MNQYEGPELLDGSHNLGVFDCGDALLNEWLQQRAIRNQKDGSSRTWVATAQSSQDVVAFYASNTAVLARSSATGRVRRNQPDPLPAMLLGRLAVDEAHQGRGLAAALVKHFILKSLEVANITGLRLVLVHAKDEDAANFYRHHGFEDSPVDRLTLMMLVKDIQ